jgi:diguanylate cyclase (GGDEF)-like protein/PAS domain S-box-containing protein
LDTDQLSHISTYSHNVPRQAAEIHANGLGEAACYGLTARGDTRSPDMLSFLSALVHSCDDGIIGLDREGVILFWNKGAELIYGYSSSEMAGKLPSILLPAVDAQERGRFHEQLARGEAVRHHEAVHLRKDGRPIDVSISISPIAGPGGQNRGLAMTVRDITEAKRMQRELHRSELKFRSLVENTPAVTFIGGPDPADCYISPQVEAMLGYTQTEWFSDPQFFLNQIHAEDRDTVWNVLSHCAETGRATSIEHRIHHKDGRILWNAVNLAAVHDEHGNFRYVLGVALDATKRKEAEERLRSSEALLRTAQRVAHAGSWQIDLSTGACRWSEELHRIFGVPPEETPSYERFLQLVHPDDAARVKAATDAALAEGKAFRLEFRVVRPDGSVRVIRSVAEVMADDANRPASIIGADQDVTENANLEELFRTLVRSSPIGNYIIQDRALKFVNPMFETHTGYSEQELLGKDPMMLVVPEDREMVRANAIRMLRGELTTPYEYRVRFRTGDTRWIMETVASIQYNGRRAVLGNFMDVTQRIEAEETIRRLAYYDSLTGLPNRTLFTERLKFGIEHARRYGGKLAVVMLDLDGFKCINDTLGHGAGDRVLREVGQRLTSLLRKADTVVRMGGDEFLLLIPELSSAADARDVVQRAIEALRAPFLLEGKERRVTASVGVAVFPDDSDDAQCLLQQADAAMYWVKERGRDGYSYYRTNE